MKYREAFDFGRNLLAEHGIGEADTDARMLLEWVCKADRNEMYLRPNRELTQIEMNAYQDSLSKRKTHFPLQYITGEQEFMGLTFVVDNRVLIPRYDTEILVEEAMIHTHDGMKILDICTGSGCILISLLHYKNDCTGLGVDISKDALEVARENASRLKSSAQFIESDLFEKVEGKFDIVISNPPYIQTEVIHTLMDEVKTYEPMLALDGMQDGLFFYRKIVNEIREYLTIGGYLLFEIGYDQGSAVKEMMEAAGFVNVTIKKDYAGLDRVVFGSLGNDIRRF